MQNQSSTQFAVVTGASSGIGLELAKQFGSHGHDLLITRETIKAEQHRKISEPGSADR
jgi:short-subunit dehydrogenase